jgi:hypothetical protein
MEALPPRVVQELLGKEMQEAQAQLLFTAATVAVLAQRAALGLAAQVLAAA